jgi:AcrR family transcriptional regulator
VRPAKLNDDDSRRRQEIIEAAARVFAEKGFRNATNRDIAREAGVSSGLIYWYFTDKKALFIAAVREMYPLRKLDMPGDELLQRPLEDVLVHLGSMILETITHPDTLRLIRIGFSELVQFPEVGQSFGQLIGETVIRGLAEHFDARVRAGTVRPIDTRLTAQAYCGALVAWVLRKYIYLSPDLADTPDDDMVLTTSRIFAAGLAIDPAAMPETPSTREGDGS